MQNDQKQITRGEFFRCCAMGAGSLVAISALPAMAQSGSGNPEVAQLKGSLDKAQVRYASMVRILEKNLDEPARNRIMDNLGQECARMFLQAQWDKSLSKYKGNLSAFLKDMQGPNGFLEKAEYDEKKGALTVTYRFAQCSCPLVKQGTTSDTQCLCSLGAQKEIFARLTGKPVDGSVGKSILRGDSRCEYRLQILS